MKSAQRIFLFGFLAVALPLLAYVAKYGFIAPVYLFAGDAFYYLDIARHRVLNGVYSFDGVNPTNGFHPLWTWILVLLGKLHLVDFRQCRQPLVPVFLADVLLLSLGSGLLAATAARLLKQPWLAMLAVAPGLFWFLVSPFTAGSFSTWSFANGMESAAALAWFGGACLAMTRPLEKNAVWASATALLLSLCVLSRLDDIFLAGLATSWILWKGRRQRRLQLLTAGSFLTPIALYLAYNHITVGTFLPVSGAAKASFAALLNLRRLAAIFLPVLTGDGPSVLQTFSYFSFGEVLGKLAQMLLPAALCAAELARSWHRRRTLQRPTFLDALALGVLLKAAYNFAFVFLWNQGQWYYTTSIAVANLILVLWLERLLDALRPERGWAPPLRTAAVTGYVLLALLSFNLFISLRNATGPVNEVHLLENSSAFQAKLQQLGATRILEFDDGFTSYIALRPAIAGIGLALDYQATQAAHSGHLLDLLWKRGYRAAVAAGAYAVAVQNANQVNTEKGHDAIFVMHASEFDHYRLLPAGTDGSTDGLTFYRIEKR